MRFRRVDAGESDDPSVVEEKNRHLARLEHVYADELACVGRVSN